MADSTPTDTSAPRKTLRRSPSYPAINLETAVRRARELYDREHQHLTSVSTVATHWKYKSLNGPAHLALAALKKYGLIVDDGKGTSRRAGLTDLAVDILENPDRRARDEALQQAALNPPIHRELWESFGNSPLSDANLKWTLTRERGFTESGATEFVRVYKDTVAFAKLDSLIPPSSVQAELEGTSGVAAEPDEPDPSAQQQREERGSSLSTIPYTIPVFNGRSVVVEGQFPLSERDWEQFMTVLAAMKPALVKRPEDDEL